MKGREEHTKTPLFAQPESYLVPNPQIRGVGEPYALEANFKEASAPLDPSLISGSDTPVLMASIPSPLVGKLIRLPDGSSSAPALSWAGETTSGLYRSATNTFHWIHGATSVTSWSSTAFTIHQTLTMVGTSVQMPNASYLYFRNAANSSYLKTLSVDSAEDLRLGEETDDIELYVNGSLAWTMLPSLVPGATGQTVGTSANPVDTFWGQYGFFLTAAGAPIIFGSGAAGGSLSLASTSHATQGLIEIGTNSQVASQVVIKVADGGFGIDNQTSAAGADAGTLANAPAAGDPDFWVKIDINGTPAAFPCWYI